MEKFDELSALAEYPDEIAPAVWFHDGIYEPLSQDNEQQSAIWARKVIIACGLQQEIADHVYNLVMATCHRVKAVGGFVEQSAINEAYHADFHTNISKHWLFVGWHVWKFYIVWHWRIVALLRIRPTHTIIFIDICVDTGIFMPNYRRYFVPIGHKWRRLLFFYGQFAGTVTDFAHRPH